MQMIGSTNSSGFAPAKATLRASVNQGGAVTQSRPVTRLTAAALLVFSLSGCMAKKKAANNENFKRAINAYFYTGHDECLFQAAYKFPNEVRITEKDEMKTMDALSKAGLLTRIEDGAFKLVRYSLSPLGTRATGRFCYGHRDITTVDNFTPVHVVEKRQASDVSYHYKLVDTPVWAQDPGIKKAFPELARKIDGDAEGKTTVMAAYAGWEVPDYGKPVIK